MLSDDIAAALLEVIITAWNSQRGMNFNPEDFTISLEEPGVNSRCTLQINSKRVDDHFNIKASVTDFGVNNTVGGFRLTQRENYYVGPCDEVQVVDVVLAKEQFIKLQRLVTTPNFMFLVNHKRRWYGNPTTGQVYGVFGRIFGRR